MRVQVRDTVQTGSIFIPALYDGGAITMLLPAQTPEPSTGGEGALLTVRVSSTA